MKAFGLRLFLPTLLALLVLVASGGTPAHAQPDTDGDGWPDFIEEYLDTDPNDNCPDNGTDDAWPLDMNKDRFLNVTGDLLPYLGKIGLLDTDPGWNAAVQRLDLHADGAISVVLDMYESYYYMLGQACNGGTPNPVGLPMGGLITMGIDPETTGNTANTLGALEACVRVDVDPNDFDDDTADHTIDVYVTGDTLPPTAYDAWLVYDADRVDPESWDDLIKLPGAGSYTNKMTAVSRLIPAALYLPTGSGSAGDGTIVRIDLDVISAGLACFQFGVATAYSSFEPNDPGVYRIHTVDAKAASLAINQDCDVGDSDGDAVIDMCDNCPNTPNAGQQDLDADGTGDACELAAPVGGMAELPDAPGSSAPNWIVLAGAIAATGIALTAGAWYARRRWLA